MQYLMLLLQFWKLDPKFVSMMSCMTENFVICAKDNPFITYKIKTRLFNVGKNGYFQMRIFINLYRLFDLYILVCARKVIKKKQNGGRGMTETLFIRESHMKNKICL